MNQFQHELLMFIDRTFVNYNEYNSFDKIINELSPLYKQNNALLDQTQIKSALIFLMETGHIESTNNNYRITGRGLIYTRLYPTVIEFLEGHSEKIRQQYQTTIGYLWLAVIVTFILSLFAIYKIK